MTNYYIMKLALIDQEIDKLTSKKKLIDIRLTELYEAREDTYTDYENEIVTVKEENKPLQRLTRKEAEKLYETIFNERTIKW